MRSAFLPVLLVLAFSAGLSAQAEEFNLAELQKAYAANNAEALPAVSLMYYGTPLFLLYPDGRLLVGNPLSKRPGFTRLTDHDFQILTSSLASLDAFWRLSAYYNLAPNMSDQPLHVLTLRLPGRPEKSVSVYGALDAPFPTPAPPPAFTTLLLHSTGRTQGERQSSAPPPAFTAMLRLLERLTPRELTPWDPGYVEIYWSDYNYAPDESLPWPKDWPGLSSPLVRRGKADDLIKYCLVFPSSKVAELDQLLASRPGLRAILIDGWKGSANYRWPLPNEKKWSSWTR